MIQVDAQMFDLLAPRRVNTHTTLVQAWTNAQPADTHLPRPANDADAEDVIVRNAVPMSHDQVVAILDAVVVVACGGTNTMTAALYPWLLGIPKGSRSFLVGWWW